ncbi:MAG: hypothetical protein A2076_16425 [Geobacteraceae bacterium GWC2_53_11]|nr:MAG: hypothetical protein A2076_16425 [Geobacteraceae bacterium GWC2_53_11]
MACKQKKQIVITILDQKHLRDDWYIDFDGQEFQKFLPGLIKEMKRLGVELSVQRNRETVISVNSYADLLNVVKISSPQDGHSNQCVGHIIGKSQRLDIMEDIGTAVRRIAFAPETIAPSSEFRKVCHNCGCGC